MIYTYVMFLMRADPLRGQAGGGWVGAGSAVKRICLHHSGNFFLSALIPHLYTSLNNGQCSKLKSQNLLEINRKL
jgi:hypothetical protein